MTYPAQFGPVPQAPAPTRPSGVPAIIAGILAMIAGLWCAVWTVGGGLNLASQARIRLFEWFLLVGNGLAALPLLIGAVLLFARKAAGRVILSVGAALMIITYVVAPIIDGIQYEFEPSMVFMVLFLIPPFVAALLALLPVTGRWCAHGRSATAPQGWYPSAVAPSGGPFSAHQQGSYPMPYAPQPMAQPDPRGWAGHPFPASAQPGAPVPHSPSVPFPQGDLRP